jgi:hypothetical protein
MICTKLHSAFINQRKPWRYGSGIATVGAAQLASDSGLKGRRQLERGRNARPKSLDHLSAPAGLAHRLSRYNSLRPAKVDLSEIEVGVLRTDVMEDSGDGMANAVTETFG